MGKMSLARLGVAAAALAALLATVFSGCASGGAARKAPDWVLSAPEEKDGYMFFVGAGDRGSLADSEEQARLKVTDEILTFVGAEISSQTDATVKATLDSYKADVTRSVRVSSEARLKSLELVDKWVDPKTATAVYVLYRCEKKDLLAEQRRLEGLIREILSLVSTPEGEGSDFADEGRYYDAALRYIQAASAAAGLDIPNKDVKFERNIAAAKDALGKITILAYEGDGMQAVAGKEFPRAFRAIVVAGARASDSPVPDVSVRISYRTMGSGGRMRTDTSTAKSDADGVVSFSLPAPRFVGDEKVTVSLNAAPYLEPLQKAPKDYQAAVSGLEQLAAQKKATLSYTVVSMARDVPMGVAVAELDAGRSLLASSETGAAILGELSAQKFRVKTLKAELVRIAGSNDADVAVYLASSFGAEVKRAAFGVSQIVGSEKDGDKIVVKVKAVVKVTDFESGETRLSVEKSTSALGNTAEAAAAAAFRKVGQLVAQEIAANLW